MSFTALNWAWEQECHGGGVAKAVLVYLANCASQDGGDCFPSLGKICRRVQHTERAVRKAVASLIEQRLIEKEPRLTVTGRCTSPHYRLPVVPLATPAKTQGSTPVNSQESPPVESHGEGCENAGVTPAKTQGNTSLVPEEESVTPETLSTRAHARATRGRKRPAETEHPRFAEFYAAYPRRQGRRHAARAFAAAIARGADPDAIIAAVQRQRPNPNPKYRKLPVTWLNGDCWRDEPEPTRDERLMEIVGLKPGTSFTPTWSMDDTTMPYRPLIGSHTP
jgi:hypothetical protein